MDAVRDFIVDHPDKLFIVAQPETDELFVSFKGKAMFGKFEGGVVSRAVNEDSFMSAWQSFSSQLMATVGIDQGTGGKFVNGVLDSIQTIGETLSDKPKKNASKSKKGTAKGTAKKKRS